MSGKTVLPAWLAAAALLGCERAPESKAPAAPEPAAEAPAEPLPEADIDASLDALGADPPRPGAEPPRFAGRWAAEEAMCGEAAWTFTATGLETPAGSACRFVDVRAVPGGYDVAARCTAEGPERDDAIRLRFAEPAGGMTFESEAIADAGLVRCGGEG